MVTALSVEEQTRVVLARRLFPANRLDIFLLNFVAFGILVLTLELVERRGRRAS
jgi:hypothetical protein